MPAQIDALSKVYARSLYELAEAADREKILEVADELEQIDELVREHRPLRELLASPIVDATRRAASLRRVFGNRVTDLTLRFLLVLNQKGRLGHLQSIVAAFDHLVQEAFGKVEVDVYTAAPLEPEQRQDLRQRIQAALLREPVLHTYIDPAMIGGLKLRLGDRLIDASIATQLRRMKQGLLDGAAATLRERSSKFIDDKN